MRKMKIGVFLALFTFACQSGPQKNDGEEGVEEAVSKDEDGGKDGLQAQAGAKNKKPAKIYPKEQSTAFFFHDRTHNHYYANKHAKFAIKPVRAGEAVDRIEVAVDSGQFTSYQSPIAFNSEGPHLIRFRSKDAVSNLSPIQTFKVYVGLYASRCHPLLGRSLQARRRKALHQWARRLSRSRSRIICPGSKRS